MQGTDEEDRLRHRMERLIGIPFTDGNAVTRLKNGDEIFPAMLDAIAAAEERIDFLTFVYWKGEIADRFARELARRAKDGLRVRVLLDAFGAMPMPDRLSSLMKESGVDLQWFRPMPRWRFWQVNHRTHRKIMVVDGRIGFTGGVGIASEWEGDARCSSEWRDDHFVIRGPAVCGLEAAFLNNWAETENGLETIEPPTPEILPENNTIQVIRSVASGGWSDMATVLQGLLSSAERRLRISTAYFAPDDVYTRQLCAAAERGVQIDIIIPGPYIDKRLSELASTKEFVPLIRAGVRLWTFQPTMLHLKMMTVDGIAACIGSPNVNQRSLRNDDEIALVVLDQPLVSQLDRDFAEDLARSELVTLEKIRSRSLVRRLREAIARPLRPVV